MTADSCRKPRVNNQQLLRKPEIDAIAEKNLKLIQEVNLRFETQLNVWVQTRKKWPRNWQAESLVYFNRPIVFWELNNCPARSYATLMYATALCRLTSSLNQQRQISCHFQINIITNIEVEQWSHSFWPSQFLQYWSAKALHFRSTIGLFHVIHQLTVLTNLFWQDQTFDYELLPLTLSIDLQR